MLASVKSATGVYLLGFALLTLTALAALLVLQLMRARAARREVDEALVQMR